MQKAPGDAQLGEEFLSRSDIERLAVLYDAFAHALNPFSAARDTAEADFNRDVTACFDLACAVNPAILHIGFRDFRREVILRCRAFLRSDHKKPTTIQLKQAGKVASKKKK